MNKHQYTLIKMRLIFVVVSLITNLSMFAQQAENFEKRKAQITPLPAISYAPETGATIGIIADYYFDLAKGDTTVSRSRFRFLATVTTKQQAVLEPSWELYSPSDNYRTFGKINYRIFNDRNYGYGNTPNQSLTQYEEQKDGTYQPQLLNFLPFDLKRFWVEATLLKKIKPNLYIGPAIDFDNVFDVKKDSVLYDPQTDPLTSHLIESKRFGIGVNLTFDKRNSRFYPTQGFFGQFNSTFYFNKAANYSFNKIDLRYYINVVKNHTFAARMLSQNIVGANVADVPIYGLARLGGRNLLRGYFFGTYQHENAITLQTEYRLPFTFLQNSFLPLLGRLGAVAFFSGGQVYGSTEKFELNNFRLACGAGIRFNINKKETTNIRIDYGFGLHPEASINNKGQQALYFYLSESF